MNIDFKIAHDIRHKGTDTFVYAFTLSIYCDTIATLSKKHIKQALIEYMKDFGAPGIRWTYSTPDAWFAYVRFKDEADAMLFKLTH